MSNKVYRYNDEFRNNVIRLMREEQPPISQVARDFNVTEQTIRTWLKADKDKHAVPTISVDELEEQLKEEKRKNADLEQTINILKKSIAIFIQDNMK